MKERLDVILIKRGLASSRERAKAMIQSGKVSVNGRKECKAGSSFVEAEIQLEVSEEERPYVGRGGLKLEKAIKRWQIPLQDKVCMDIGASTGGFTDCMLQNGALRVYAIDVGHDQLDAGLRRDKRVVCMEKTNFRYMKPEDLPEKVDFASVDVSFISLTKILVPARELLKPQGEMVCLIKPQFEAGRAKVGKKGVVKEASIQEEVIGKIIDYAYDIGFDMMEIDYSPLKGAEGNLEYLLYMKKSREPIREEGIRERIKAVVKQSHTETHTETEGGVQKE